ncbi:hypothetical protein CTI12_AA328230 [Artemisia annua]|uniref:Piwi domain-containing protein n=1 Tax=Artemisia annua TaxID=35608 RepID=A0A2U1ME21_ARTAN|nr:hypothetical protein CTI12_AA328230 [Artemisia annua]
MTEVIGRVMKPPTLMIGENHAISAHPDNCAWEYFSREPVFMGKATKRWALINCSWASGKNKLNDVEAFIQKLRDCCTGKEVQMENPLVVRETCMSELSNLRKFRALLSSVIEESGKIDEEPLQLVFCVMADRGIGYEYLKWVSEAEIGVLTHDDDNFMFIGADVSHPDELKRLSTYSSVAAVVGSVNPPSATRYIARVSLQSPGKEEIVDFGNDERVWGNVPPGTVVDTAIVHPFEFDFYLCSHFGATGTSKPTHYTVIWDENGFSSDEMQKLIYHLSYLFACCSKPVSLVPPVYYAHLAAYRGQMLQEVAWQVQSSSSCKVADCLQDSMFFI